MDLLSDEFIILTAIVFGLFILACKNNNSFKAMIYQFITGIGLLFFMWLTIYISI